MDDMEYTQIIVDFAKELVGMFGDEIPEESAMDTANVIVSSYPDITIFLVKERRVTPSSVSQYVAEEVYDKAIEIVSSEVQ